MSLKEKLFFIYKNKNQKRFDIIDNYYQQLKQWIIDNENHILSYAERQFDVFEFLEINTNIPKIDKIRNVYLYDQISSQLSKEFGFNIEVYDFNSKTIYLRLCP